VWRAIPLDLRGQMVERQPKEIVLYKVTPFQWFEEECLVETMRLLFVHLPADNEDRWDHEALCNKPKKLPTQGNYVNFEGGDNSVDQFQTKSTLNLEYV